MDLSEMFTEDGRAQCIFSAGPCIEKEMDRYTSVISMKECKGFYYKNEKLYAINESDELIEMIKE